MSVIIPKRRDNPVGRPKITQPTRGNIKRQPVSSDPGARGGPTNIPTNAFTGGSQGTLELGSGIQQVASAESALLQQELNRSDYINTEIEKGNLANDIDRIANSFDAISGSYRNMDGSIDKNGMNRVDQLIEEATTNRINIVQKNRAMSQRASDEFVIQAELVKQNAYSKIRKNVATARNEHYKLALQSELAMIAGDKTTSSDVILLIMNNKKIANGYISSLSTKDRNTVLATANAGLLKDAARKFVIGGQFRDARLRLTDIVKQLGSNNISTTGWTGQSVREAFNYIDEEQKKYNDTQRSAKISALAAKIAEIDKLDLSDTEKQALKIRAITGDKAKDIPEFKQKLDVLQKNFDAIKNPTAEQITDFIIKRDKIISGYEPPVPKAQSDFAEKVNELNKMFPMPRTKEQEQKVMDGLYSITTGIEPKDPKDKTDLEIKNDNLDVQFVKGHIEKDVYIKAKLYLNSGYKEDPPSEYTIKQKARAAYLDKQLKLYKDSNGKEGLSPQKHKLMMAKVMTDVEIPDLDENFDLKDQKLIDNLVDSFLGAEVFGPGAKQPQKGYEEFSMKFKAAVARAMITGVYSNGLPVSPEKNYFDIITQVGKTEEFKGKGPKRQKPSERFDSRVGVKIVGVGKNLTMEIQDQPLMGDPSDSLTTIIGEATATVESEYFKNRLINAGIKTGLSVERATGIWSGLKNAIAKFSEFLGEGSEDPRVTQSRLLYSLIARDFIRFVSLSPRFAVKEQELLRDLFPSSGALNSPRQTRSRLMLFRNLLKKKIGDLRSTAINIQAPEKQEEAIESAKVWAGTIRNINMLMPEVAPVDTLDNLKNLAPQETYKFLQTEIFGENPRLITRDDMNDYKARLIRERGKKQGEARFKILDKKLADYQKEILRGKTP